MVGINALITIISHLFFITMAFWAIQGIHFERFVPMRLQPGKLLIVLLSVTIGYITSSFFLSIIDNIHNLIFLIK